MCVTCTNATNLLSTIPVSYRIRLTDKYSAVSTNTEYVAWKALRSKEQAMDLADIATDDLLAEVQRRMHCMDKPEKRVIMVGKCTQALPRVPGEQLCVSLDYSLRRQSGVNKC